MRSSLGQQRGQMQGIIPAEGEGGGIWRRPERPWSCFLCSLLAKLQRLRIGALPNKCYKDISFIHCRANAGVRNLAQGRL